jgi:hypothetical protein
VPPVPSYFKPLDNKKIIQHLLEEFSKCFSGPSQLSKKNELLFLAKLLEE